MLTISRLSRWSLGYYNDTANQWYAGGWVRLFTVQEWQIGAVFIAVAGEQTHTGDVSLRVYVGGEDQLSKSDLAPYADALAQAASLLDALG